MVISGNSVIPLGDPAKVWKYGAGAQGDWPDILGRGKRRP